jgi:KDO2-lipid IV(A) lauroyltransferase
MEAEAKTKFREFQGNIFFRSLISAFTHATKILPRWFMRPLAYFCILFFIWVTMSNFKAIFRNMRTIFPERGTLKLVVLSFRMYLKYAYYLIDMFYMSHDRDRIKKFKINYVGEDILQSALNEKRGIILLTLHMGNWEIGGIAMSEKGITPPTVAYFPDSQDIIESQRSRFRDIGNANHIELREGRFSAIKLLRVLQDGGIVAIQGDRLQYDSGVEMEMFGHKADFPRGPIMLASAADAIIVPTFMVMEGYNTYNIYIEKPIEIKVYSGREDTLKNNFKEIIGVFEKYIRQYPDQWYTFMPFWAKDKEKFTQ